MNTPTDFAKQAKMRAYIALLDQAIAMAEGLEGQINDIGQLLAERFPEAKAA